MIVKELIEYLKENFDDNYEIFILKSYPEGGGEINQEYEKFNINDISSSNYLDGENQVLLG